MRPIVPVAASAALVAAAAGVFVAVTRHAAAGPDPYAGHYPAAADPSATPAPGVTWRPKYKPAGPLPTFAGQSSKATGRVDDRKSGLSFDRLGPPWKMYTFGQEINTGSLAKHTFHNYGTIYANPLDDAFTSAVSSAGPNRLRAASELSARKFLQGAADQDPDGWSSPASDSPSAANRHGPPGCGSPSASPMTRRTAARRRSSSPSRPAARCPASCRSPSTPRTAASSPTSTRSSSPSAPLPH